ncbi:GGDEF domain-containing protein [Acetobacterium sp. UBA5834]|jgi:diguanylate cyclase (GGDEF)-like protein|uniref:GGDEF domain-containing protein n=1 Tax=Acetobacterium sp. UBA5834 TaxID=1945907 RepID=UPI00257E75F0|nr:GGDEF domain-containing protein [Acetobacterium sp. UBA5834]
MNLLVYTLQANIYALIILSIIFVNFRKRADLTNASNRFFLIMLKVVMAILILDSIGISLYGLAGQPIHFLLILLTLIYYLLNPLPSLFWMAYVHYTIHRSEKRLKKLVAVALLPVYLNSILSIASIFTGWLFYFGADNVYQRGPLFVMVPICCYFYIFLSFVMILWNRNRIRQRDLLPLLFFALPPFLAGIIQALIYGLAITWPALTISLLTIYIFIQSRTMNTDHLTGLYNRREFDYYLEDWMNWHSKKKQLAGFMLDLDRFKEINDNFGHNAGDRALINMSEILRKSFRNTDFIARIGGDEFVVVLEVDDQKEIDGLLERLKENMDNFNKQTQERYKLSVSSGSGMFFPEREENLSEFFGELDRLMYVEKAMKKNISV